MATSQNHNGFSGRLGNTVSYLLNGQAVQRKIGAKKKSSTQNQLPSQQVTRLVNTFLRPVRALVKFGFQAEAAAAMKTGYTMATIYTRANAIVGVYPNQRIDFERVLFTRGNLPTTLEATTEVLPGGIKFNWEDQLSDFRQHLHDRSILIAYNVDTGAAYYELHGNRRHQGTDTLFLPGFKHKVKLETYLSFISLDQFTVSNSVYLGSLLY